MSKRPKRVERRYRRIVFTINAPTPPEDVDPFSAADPTLFELPLIDPFHSSWRAVRFMIYQREMGSHEHFQGYLELTEQLTFKQLHAFVGFERAYFAEARGKQTQCIHYCSKPHLGCVCPVCLAEREDPTYVEGPWTVGEPANQGQRNDLLAVKQMIDDGASVRRLWDESFPEMVRFGKGLSEYHRLRSVPRSAATPTVVLLFVGPPGVGKSTTMHRLASYLSPPGQRPFCVPQRKGSGLYYDGYDGEEVMILDEFDGERMRPVEFNQLCDPLPYLLPAHGHAGAQMRSRYLLIGSNYLPKYWWRKRNTDQVRQTTRRIHATFFFADVGRLAIARAIAHPVPIMALSSRLSQSSQPPSFVSSSSQLVLPDFHL